jgi:hypothetical protein
MSGVIGHSLYAVLALKASEARGNPIAAVLRRHYASYLAGAYLGCDIQTLPASVGMRTGAESGYAKLPSGVTELNGEPVQQWKLEFEGRTHAPGEVHSLYYGRAHLILGWPPTQRDRVVPVDHLPDYFAAVADDAVKLFEPGERRLAYVFGWICHAVGDAMIKSVIPGADLRLLDGTYTPENRPIQDLVSFHEIGRRELGLDWRALLNDACDTPVEDIQTHYMRCASRRGRLGEMFPDAWEPGLEGLLRQVMAKNREHLKVWLQRVFRDMELKRSGEGWECRPELSRRAKGLTYPEMVEAADKAGFRRALWRIAERIAGVFDETVERSESLRDRKGGRSDDWRKITSRWMAK